MNKLQKIILLFLIISVAAAAAGGAIMLSSKSARRERPEKTCEEYITEGENYYENSSYQQALVSFRKARELEEDNIEALRGEGKSLRAIGYQDDALEVYEEIYSLDDVSIDDIVELINVCIQNKELDKARDIAEENEDKDETGQISEMLRNMHVDKPVLNLSSGTYDDYQFLYVTENPENCSFYYTLDGSDPTDESDMLRDGIVISAPQNRVKVRAYSYLGYYSDVVDLNVNITKIVEQVDGHSRIGSYIRSNVLNKDWNDPLYNYELARVTQLYVIGYNVQTEENNNYSFFKDHYMSGSSRNEEYDDELELKELEYMPFLKKLVIAYYREVDLSGIEYCTNLEELSLLHNHIDNIDSLKNLTKLTKLSLGWNDIEDISVISGMKSLTSLGLWSNKINDVTPLRELTDLEYLDVADNSVTSIDIITGMKGLNELWIYDNNISDLSPVSECAKLKVLMQSGNPGSGKNVSEAVIKGLSKTDWE